MDIPTRPDQDMAVLIHRQVPGKDEFVFDGLQRLLIQCELDFQRPLGHPAALLEELHDLSKHRIEVHHRPSTCARDASAWGSQ